MRILSFLLVLVVGAVACDRNMEPYVEGEEARAPDLARIFPEQAEAPARPAAAPPAQAPRPAPASGPGIRGTIEIAPEVAGSVPAGGMLFVIARPAGVEAGPPLAVLRVPGASFPHGFEIGPANVMIPTMRFEGEIQLTARLDADGNATTRGSGDLSGRAADTASPGASGVRIVLDTRQ